MGTFRVNVEVGDPDGRRYERVEALGVVPHARDHFVLAAGRSAPSCSEPTPSKASASRPTLSVDASCRSPASSSPSTDLALGSGD